MAIALEKAGGPETAAFRPKSAIKHGKNDITFNVFDRNLIMFDRIFTLGRPNFANTTPNDSSLQICKL
ncbi:MAG: hypothetical protein ACR2II_03370 [Chthoniobacterales bacterium]